MMLVSGLRLVRMSLRLGEILDIKGYQEIAELI